jgi:hypothetical protein
MTMDEEHAGPLPCMTDTQGHVTDPDLLVREALEHERLLPRR